MLHFKMSKARILLFIPIAIVAGFLLYTWTIILFSEVVATWRHYLALGLFITICFTIYKRFTKGVIATGGYLVLGTINCLTITPSNRVNSYGLRIGSLEMWTPSFQLLSFGILLLYLILNFDMLIDIYLDYSERKRLAKK
jgi:hypothetical protein